MIIKKKQLKLHFHIFDNPTDYVNPNEKLEIDEIPGK